MYKILGIEPIEINIKLHVLTLFHNLWTMKDNEAFTICKMILEKDSKGPYWINLVKEICTEYEIGNPLKLLKIEPPKKNHWKKFVKEKILRREDDKLTIEINKMSSIKYMDGGDFLIAKKPTNFIKIQKEPSEFRALNITLRHIIGEYPNNVNKNRYGRAKSTHCHICKSNSKRILEDDTHHNIWECDMVLMSSTCRKLKQLIFNFITARSTITNCDL